MKTKGKFITSNDSIGEVFEQTMNLRYAEKEIPMGEGYVTVVLRLRQMWQGSNGTQEWRWVEVEEI